MKKYQFILPIVVMIFVQRSLAQTKEEFSGLIFSIPANFNVQKTENSLQLSDRSSTNEQYFTITVNKSTISLKKIEKSFPVFWHELLLNDGVDNPPSEPVFVKAQTTSGWNCFRGGKLVQYNPQTPPFYYHLTVMRSMGITLRVVTRASSEELFMQKIPFLMQLVSSVSLKLNSQQTTYQSNQSNTNYSSTQSNSGNTGYNQSAQITGLYISVQGDLLGDAELSVLYFLADGTVFTDIPEKGFANFNKSDYRAQYPSLFGSFTISNNTLNVIMNNEAVHTAYSIGQNGSITSTSGPSQSFKKIESLDSYLLEGTYINKKGGTLAGIVFTKSGQFTDNGLIKSVSPESSYSPSGGSGTYSSRQNSLLLQYTDGPQLQLCFYIMPEDFQKNGSPDKILIGNYLLVRQ